MSHKKIICALLFVVLFPAFNNSDFALSTGDIAAVNRKALIDKDVLSQSDLNVIDEFLQEAFVEMIKLENYTEMIDVRDRIIVLAGSNTPSQYLVTYRASAVKQIEIAFKAMVQWEDGPHKMIVTQNLLILAAEIDGAEMVPFGLKFLTDKNTLARYWAVKIVVSDSVAELLNSETSTDINLEKNVMKSLSAIVEVETQPEILGDIASFAGKVNSSAATELLIKIADLRTAQYANWTVKYELIETDVLNALGGKILGQTASSKKTQLSAKFAQLYSYVIQRYLIGQEILSDESKSHLVSVMAEVENSLIGKLMERLQSVIRKAIEKKRLNDLQSEHDDLLGSDLRAGELAKKLNFNYGKDADGKAIDMPKKLELPSEN